MNDKSFTLEIVTPDRVVFSGNVDHVQAPGRNGSFGVKTHHEPFMTMLRVGTTRFETGSKVQLFATSKGFCTINNEKMTLLCDSAEKADEINLDRAREAKGRALERLQSKSKDIDVQRAERALARALNRIELASI